MVLALEDSLLFQVKAKEIHSSPHPKAELSRGHHVESVARMIHLLCGVLARMRRMASVRSSLSAGINGRWEVIAPCGEGTALTLQDVCLPHSLPGWQSCPRPPLFQPSGPVYISKWLCGSLPPLLKTTGHNSKSTGGSAFVLKNTE